MKKLLAKIPLKQFELLVKKYRECKKANRAMRKVIEEYNKKSKEINNNITKNV